MAGCYARQVTSTPASFDGRADDFDRRSAPPDDAAAAIASAVHDIASHGGSGALLDLGAGTGVIGAPLARLCANRDAGYVALDLSLGMLAVFRSRWQEDQPSLLLRADASRAWPLADASVGAIFAARAAHLFAVDAFLGEVRRVLPTGGVLILGAIRRDRDAPRAVLRRKLHNLLGARGIEPRNARRRHGELSDLLHFDEATPSDPEIAASWTVRESLDTALAAWRRPGHLAGRDVPASLRREVLDDLHSWALDRWSAGRYDAGHASDTTATPTAETKLPTDIELRTIERFELTTVRI